MGRSTVLSLPIQLVFPAQTSKTLNLELRIRSVKLECSFCGNFLGLLYGRVRLALQSGSPKGAPRKQAPALSSNI
jgi:hypothetical protein